MYHIEVQTSFEIPHIFALIYQGALSSSLGVWGWVGVVKKFGVIVQPHMDYFISYNQFEYNIMHMLCK